MTKKFLHTSNGTPSAPQYLSVESDGKTLLNSHVSMLSFQYKIPAMVLYGPVIEKKNQCEQKRYVMIQRVNGS